MPPLPAQTFSAITLAQFAALQQKAASNGIDLNSNSGITSTFGVEVTWNYAPETGELTIQCLTAPFFLSTEAVNARIKALVEQAIAQS